jgi:hypothetical protein
MIDIACKYARMLADRCASRPIPLHLTDFGARIHTLYTLHNTDLVTRARTQAARLA